ncbi:DUF445 domain-containing protein [Candidatus Uabimicrobium sp. HlEnr_7]|uniref:DUF445 domain-containing protein n=1 Tax=Candidatus Uabimicrobium helgolandensis TaxID=3095367 RepID=UPI00355887A0
MKKSLFTNLISLAVFVAAYFSPQFYGQQHLYQASLFALSGAFTNWLAVYMLFEKIPFLYGSGIIPNRFEEFKAGIRNLIMDNFFNKENFEKYVKETVNQEIDLDSIVNGLFDKLKQTVEESSFGSMLGMFGGVAALEPLREDFKTKTLGFLNESQLVEKFTTGNYDSLRTKVEQLVDKRLEELTPQKVKEIIQSMIREHLGWLVVWGGIFGALLGLSASLFL